MFEMHASSLLSLIQTVPAGGNAILPAMASANGTEGAETGGFAQVLALLPRPATKPRPGMETAAPVATGEATAPAAPAILPESGKILPVGLPPAAPESPAPAIPAGILAILPQGDLPKAMPKPDQAAPAQTITAPRAKPAPLAAARSETVLTPPEEPMAAEATGAPAPAPHSKDQPVRAALARSQSAPAPRKSAHTSAETAAPDRRDEQAPEATLFATAPTPATPKPELTAEAPVALPLDKAPAPQLPAQAGRPIAPLPDTAAATQPAAITPAAAPIARAVLHQQPHAEQRLVTPGRPAEAPAQPRAAPPQIALPLAALAPDRAPPLQAAELTIEADSPPAPGLTIVAPLRAALPHRGDAAVTVAHGAFAAPVAPAVAREGAMPGEQRIAVFQPADPAAPAAQAIPAPAAPSPFVAPDLSSAPAMPTERPADFTQIVDRLIAARDVAGSGQPQPVHVSLSHAEFGKVSLRFTQDDGALSVALSSPDPDFARAAQIAAPAQSQAADANAGGTGSQPQSRSSDSPAFASNGQPQFGNSQSGANGNTSQRQPAPEFRTPRSDAARPDTSAEGETSPERRHRFA